MRPARLAALALAAALAASAGLTAAQQPAPQPKQAPSQPAKPAAKSARVYYDTYEASRRFPTRSGGCLKSEDPLGNFCVQPCKKGYVEVDDRRAGVRQCRSAKPLPPGVLPTSGQKQTSTQRVPVQRPSGPAAP